jgi:hypothetical protein
MKKIAERMKQDKEFFDTTMQELKVKNPQLFHFIRTAPDKFYKLAENGKLDNIAKKSVTNPQDELAIRKVE